MRRGYRGFQVSTRKRQIKPPQEQKRNKGRGERERENRMAPTAAAMVMNRAPKTILITGVSRGLGRALAVEMAKKGHTIIGCSRAQDRLNSLLDELSSSQPPQDNNKNNPSSSKHLLMKVDVRSDSSVQELARAVMETKGVPDIIGNAIVADIIAFPFTSVCFRKARSYTFSVVITIENRHLVWGFDLKH
ncbi:uncharacterized protein LOC122072283 [Macadamia integrifolia]|uniref:uncharacterized protein LOC122072283 n=1 Tax=Macadamia integrifolia TaxID=60698 RepID=UPI001C4EF5A3|nr:uncharacterized protein LOC122072283 [Macadamia integrifolia]